MLKLPKILLLVTTIVSMTFASCSVDDGYDAGVFNVTYGVVKGDESALSIITDKGNTLFVTVNAVNGFSQMGIKDGMRVIINFTILGENTDGYSVRLNAIDKLLTKKPFYASQLTEEELKEIGTDPIEVIDAWFSASKYLNINFDVFRHSPALVHFINLEVDEVNSTPESVIVTLKHNAFGDPKSYRALGRVSFDITGLVPEGKEEIKLTLKWTDYRGREYSDWGTFRTIDEGPIYTLKGSSDFSTASGVVMAR